MGFEPHLHWSFANEHVLLPSITLHSFSGFLLACLVTVVVCLSERFVSTVLDAQWAPASIRLSHVSISLWRTALYSLATFLRLCYMLIAMSFHLGLILTIVFTLSAAQFVVELRKEPKPSFSIPRTNNPYDTSSQPLLSDSDHHYQPNYPPNYPLTSVKTRPRSKSKPEAIFIHPAESNIARADAVALELGLAGSTERVQSYGYTKEEPPWEMGKGKDMAREMLLGSAQSKKSARPVSPPSRSPFYLNDSDSDESTD